MIQADVRRKRVQADISPSLPPVEEREAIKAEYLSKLKSSKR